MRYFAGFLIFLFPLSIFSAKISGFEFYPAYLLIPFGIKEILFRIRVASSARLSRSSFVVGLFVLLLALHALMTPFLIPDIFKFASFVFLYFALISLSTRSNIPIASILDYAVCVMVFYGLFQMIAVLCGRLDLAAGLHMWFARTEFAGPVDRRGVGLVESVRISSLTHEASYFAFTVGVHILLTKSRITRFLCLIGIFLSFSLITIYGWAGLGLYTIWKRFRMPSWIFYIGALIVHLAFVSTIYEDVPQKFYPTFLDRYAGLVGFLNLDALQMLFGSLYTDASYPANLMRPYSNLGSVVYLFGLVGFALYAYVFWLLEKESPKPKAIAMMFLMMFNYYYLTSWPIVAGFLFLAMQKPKIELASVPHVSHCNA